MTAPNQTAADVASDAYFATLTPGRVKRERWLEPITVTWQNNYDRVTEQKLTLIRTNERKTA